MADYDQTVVLGGLSERRGADSTVRLESEEAVEGPLLHPGLDLFLGFDREPKRRRLVRVPVDWAISGGETEIATGFALAMTRRETEIAAGFALAMTRREAEIAAGFALAMTRRGAEISAREQDSDG